ncbi:MAG: DNA-binding MarR family transcriptional regulator [Ilumatobacter sp.]|jgi:DNA-binding MarR family transcriptional regulator
MSSTFQSAAPVDFTDPKEAEHAIRIGRAWVELRRGAWTQQFRDYLFGDEEPLEPGQMDALDLLARRDRTMRQLAERLRIDPSSATRAVQRLVADGLAERFAAPGDGRVVMVRISETGRARRSDVDARRTYVMSVLLSEFTPEERNDLADLLSRYVTALDQTVSRLT